VSYPIVFGASAARELSRLPREVQLRFLCALDLLVESPTRPSPQLQIKQMRGHPGFWRLAIGP